MNPPSASPAICPDAQARVRVAGKFFARGGRRVFLNGVSFGPFAPNERGEPFPADGQLARDFAHIRTLGFNAVRLYELPSELALQTARENGLLIIAGIPWAEHVDFLADSSLRRDIEQRVREAARRFGKDETVAAFVVGNEIEKTLVRWMGPRRVRRFLDRLIEIGRAEAPDTLFTYATYPSTEYLMPEAADFLAVNVYLEDRGTWSRYLSRLQNLAGNKPLVITEFGLDVQTHGEAAQATMMTWQRETLLESGAAGNVWFAYTDEWHRGGAQVTRWSFGLKDRWRAPRIACEAAPQLPVVLAHTAGPLISVIVCTYNGSSTLRECLEALTRQCHSNMEVLVIDDGSTDSVPAIAKSFPGFRYIHQSHGGLSVARNLGMKEARGEILAYTDDDCIPDEEWLLRIARALDDPQWIAAGGPNIPPPARNRTERLVAAAPGAPTHVLLHDEEAEHLPGCNFCVRKSALEGIGGFHADFRTAGDDVDVCWRLREAGGKLRFVPGAMVWHHRRFAVRAYFRQQSGYGRAEALLMKHHPSRFGPLGGARWRGAIYGDGFGLRNPDEGSIFHGPFGFAPFQAIYPQGIMPWWELFAGVTWVALVVLALVMQAPVAAASIFAAATIAAWWRATRHASDVRLFSRDGITLWFLCLVQPVVREWARVRGMMRLGARPSRNPTLQEIAIPGRPHKWSLPLMSDCFWRGDEVDRTAWMKAFREIVAARGISCREDDGWRWFDFEIGPRLPLSVSITSVTEYHGQGRCLTRVRPNIRVRRWLVWFLMLCGFAGWFFSRGEHEAVALFAIGIIAVTLGFAVVWILRARALIREAARMAGMKHIDAKNARA